MTNCVLCGGPVVSLGQLGSKAWFRCRNCGAEQFSEGFDDDPHAEPEPDPDDVCDCGHKAKFHHEDGCHVYTNASAEHPVCPCNEFDRVGEQVSA